MGVMGNSAICQVFSAPAVERSDGRMLPFTRGWPHVVGWSHVMSSY